MPAKSEKQRKKMGAALGRKRAGKSLKSDPKMSEDQLAEFARKAKGQPKKKSKGIVSRVGKALS